MKHLYLALAIVGAIVPYVFFGQFMTSAEPTPEAFMRQLFANAPASGITADLLISSGVFWIWSFHDARARQMRRWWAYVVVNLLIGLSCAFPLFLYFRERRTES